MTEGAVGEKEIIDAGLREGVAELWGGGGAGDGGGAGAGGVTTGTAVALAIALG